MIRRYMLSMWLLLFILVYVTTGTAKGDVGIQIANNFRGNVVKITVSTDSIPDNPSYGFGFIVGEHKNLLFIATAGHLVYVDSFARKQSKELTVQFCGEQLSYSASSLDLWNRERDLAIITVEKPLEFKWKKRCLARNINSGAGVWYIGQKHRCQINTTELKIAKYHKSDYKLSLEGQPLHKGSSGAPILTEDGLVGMIRKADEFMLATSIDGIEAQIDDWNNYGKQYIPWDLKGPKSRSWLSSLMTLTAIGIYATLTYWENEKWDDYSNNPSESLYQEYEKANSIRKISFGIMCGALIWAGIDWGIYYFGE